MSVDETMHVLWCTPHYILSHPLPPASSRDSGLLTNTTILPSRSISIRCTVCPAADTARKARVTSLFLNANGPLAIFQILQSTMPNSLSSPDRCGRTKSDGKPSNFLIGVGLVMTRRPYPGRYGKRRPVFCGGGGGRFLVCPFSRIPANELPAFSSLRPKPPGGGCFFLSPCSRPPPIRRRPPYRNHPGR